MSDDEAAAEHELGLALFIEPRWRPRFRESLQTERHRAKLLRELEHFRHIDPRFAEEMPTRDQFSKSLLPRLVGLGAPRTCYLMSSDDDLDRRWESLAVALAEIVDQGSTYSTFISCLPGRLAYFHDHETYTAYLLQRPAA